MHGGVSAGGGRQDRDAATAGDGRLREVGLTVLAHTPEETERSRPRLNRAIAARRKQEQA